MPEANDAAMILITTSYQALQQARLSKSEATEVTACIVVLLFAGFFIEANVNHIVKVLDKEAEIKRFWKPKNPGLLYKMGWFYNQYAAQAKEDRVQLENCLAEKLEIAYPGFTKIRDFRNEIAHGEVDRTITNLHDTEKLRDQAKTIVDRMFASAKAAGCDIPRDVTYEMAIRGNRLGGTGPLVDIDPGGDCSSG